jgi:hypothetical protein
MLLLPKPHPSMWLFPFRFIVALSNPDPRSHFPNTLSLAIQFSKLEPATVRKAFVRCKSMSMGAIGCPAGKALVKKWEVGRMLEVGAFWTPCDSSTYLLRNQASSTKTRRSEQPRGPLGMFCALPGSDQPRITNPRQLLGEGEWLPCCFQSAWVW